MAAVLAGIVSLLRGQDANWDLQNYHRYDAYALLQHRLDLDLSPAGMQTYFNPLLDVPYFLLTEQFPAPVAGFLLGAFHGLVFALLGSIALSLAPRGEPPERGAWTLACALAGCCAVSFVWGLGNTMGDDTTAVLVIASVALVISRWERLDSELGGRYLVLAGLASGCAAGLKLTNVPYAAALGLAFLVVPAPLPARLRRCTLVTTGSLAGFLASWGWWGAEMYRRFENPVFPQFGSLFPSRWSIPVSVIDGRWMVHGVQEAVLWPFIFPLDGARVSEKAVLLQFQWPLVYVLFIACLVIFLASRRGAWAKAASAAPVPGDARTLEPTIFLLAFVALGYLGWMRLFAYYRYVVPIEVLLPVCVAILWDRLLPARRSRIAFRWSIMPTVAVASLAYAQDWGHEPWRRQAFTVETPAIRDAGSQTVLLAETGSAWMIPSFPPQVSFLALAPNYPASPAYFALLHSKLAGRGGDVHVLVPLRGDVVGARAQRINRAAESLRLNRFEGLCEFAGRILARGKSHLVARWNTGNSGGSAATPACAVEAAPDVSQGLHGEQASALAKAAERALLLGISFDAARCETHMASIGSGPFPYLWCPAARLE